MAFKSDRQRKAVMAQLNGGGYGSTSVGEKPVSKGVEWTPGMKKSESKLSEATSKKIDLLKRNAAKADETAARELELFAENDGNLYRQRIVPIQQNLSKKYRKGEYDSGAAAVLWKYAADDAAQRYSKEFGGNFSPAERSKVALKLEQSWLSEMKAGNFHN